MRRLRWKTPGVFFLWHTLRWKTVVCADSQTLNRMVFGELRILQTNLNSLSTLRATIASSLLLFGIFYLPNPRINGFQRKFRESAKAELAFARWAQHDVRQWIRSSGARDYSSIPRPAEDEAKNSYWGDCGGGGWTFASCGLASCALSVSTPYAFNDLGEMSSLCVFNIFFKCLASLFLALSRFSCMFSF